MKRKTILFICVIMSLLCMVQASVCGASETTEEEFNDYSGPVDPYTGEKTDDGGNSSSSTGTIVYLSDNMYFDRDKGMYAYPVGTTGVYIYADIPDGAVVTSQQTIEVPDEITYAVYRNGEKIDISSTMTITLIGEYKITANTGTDDVEIMSFSIVNCQTGSIEYYRMPAGFFVVELVYNGEAVEEYDASCVDFTEEGTYSVTYRCTKTGETATLELSIDHTAPVIELEGVENGYADGAVTIVSISEEATVAVYFKGKLQEDAGTKFTKAGTYRLIAADPAGNITTVDFTIKIYFNVSAVAVIIILCAAAAVTAGYLIYRRKHMRVR